METPVTPHLVLRLFVAGETSRSQAAIMTTLNFCKNHLKDNYNLEIIDVFKNPELAEHNHIVATPTLIKELPPPLKRIVGDLSDKNTLTYGLDMGFGE